MVFRALLLTETLHGFPPSRNLLRCVACSLLHPVTEKLTRNNHPIWKMQVLSALKGAQLAFYLDTATQPPTPFLESVKSEDKKSEDKKEDPVPNPEYDPWMAKDQVVLSFLLTSLSKEILAQVPTTMASAKEVWAAIEGMFASQSCARVIARRMALATVSKGASTVSEYFMKMKGFAEDMASVGKKLEDDELVLYILTVLDADYNPVVSAVAARVEPISESELYTQLVSFEQCMDMQNGGHNASTNVAAHGGRGGGNLSCCRRGGGRGGGGRGGTGRGGGGRGGGRGSSFTPGVFCQLCGKEGHAVVCCFKRFILWAALEECCIGN